MQLLKIDNLKISASKSGEMTEIVKGISVEIRPYEKVGILGESGSGKTLFLESILGGMKSNLFAFGSVSFLGEDILNAKKKKRKEIYSKIAYIPQKGLEALNGNFKIKKAVFESLKIAGYERSSWQKEGREVLAKAGLENAESVLEKYPRELSGGMCQKVVFALALIKKPQLVLADEPTRGVDKEGEAQYLDQLFSSFERAGILIVTHSIAASKRCDRILVMKEGRVVDEIVGGNLAMAKSEYTKLLFENE